MKAILRGILVALLLTGCHQVTEYQGADSASIIFVRTDDLQVETEIGDLAGGRSLIARGSNEVLMISSDGVLHRISMETFSVDTSYSIGGSSGTGYGDGVIASNGSLYVLGPGSQVIEVDLGSDTVEDNFTPGSKPGAIAANPTEGRLYFVDTEEDYIGEILTSTNNRGFTSNLAYPPADVMVEPTGGRHIIAGCSDNNGTLYSIWLDVSTSARICTVSAQSPISELVPMTSDSVYAVCCPRWSSSSGRVRMITGYREPILLTTISVAGHPLSMCFNENSGADGLLSVLGRTDAGSSVLSVLALDPFHADLQLLGELEFDGVPIDVVSPGAGSYIVLLVSE